MDVSSLSRGLLYLSFTRGISTDQSIPDLADMAMADLVSFFGVTIASDQSQKLHAITDKRSMNGFSLDG